jgi:transcriptional regulator with XRE-family HTH domain
LADPEIEAVARLVVEAREKKGWTASDLSDDMGIMHFTLERLEAGEEWPDDDACQYIEESLGWYRGSLLQLRQLAEFKSLDQITVESLQEEQPQESNDQQREIYLGLLRSAEARAKEEAEANDPWRKPK